MKPALNLDGFNPLTCSLVPWLEPVFVAGGSLSANRRRDLPWGEHPRQRFCGYRLGQPCFQQRYAMCLVATTLLNFSVNSLVQDYVNLSD